VFLLSVLGLGFNCYDVLKFLHAPCPALDLTFTSALDFLETTSSVVLSNSGLLSGILVIYQLGRWLEPGLYPHERKYGKLCLTVLGGGLIFGALLTYLVILPTALTFLSPTSTALTNQNANWREYIELLSGILVIVESFILIPTFQLILGLGGFVTSKMLIQAYKYVALAGTIAVAILTPSTDPWTQLALSLLMLGFYAVGILVLMAFEMGLTIISC